MKNHLEEYLHYLKIERGLSENTIQSYKRDLSQYFSFLDEKRLALGNRWIDIWF